MLAQKIINKQKSETINVEEDVKKAILDIFEKKPNATGLHLSFSQYDKKVSWGVYEPRNCWDDQRLSAPLCYMSEIIEYLKREGFYVFRNIYVSESFAVSLYNASPDRRFI